MPNRHKLKLIADARLLAMEFVIVRTFGGIHRELSPCFQRFTSMAP
jgi:hypothetical protein